MTTTIDHLFNQKEVINCLQSAWNITTPSLPYKKIEECKLKDFELLERAIINYFKNTEFSKIDIPGAGSIQNLLLKGESKRNKAMAVMAFYVLHKDQSLTHEELKNFKKIPNENLFSSYSNRVEILNIYKKRIATNGIDFIKLYNAKLKKIKPSQIILIGLTILFIAVAIPLITFHEEPQWNIKMNPLEDENLMELFVSYQLKPHQYKNSFLKFNHGNTRKIDNQKGEIRIITSKQDIKKVDLVVSDKVFTKFYIQETNGWIASLNNKIIKDSLFKSNGQLFLKSVDNLKIIQFKKTKNFDASLDNLKFETKIRKSKPDLSCENHISLELNGVSESDITSLKIKFVDPNCEQNAELNIGNINLNSSKEDLSYLEEDFSEWVEIIGEVEDQHLVLYYNNKLVKKVPYTTSLGTIKSMSVSSNQNIMVDYFRLYNSELGYFVNDSF